MDIFFFRNLNTEQLQRIYEFLNSEKVSEDKFQVGDYDLDRYCPHQKTDLLYHGRIDLSKRQLNV